MAQRQFHESEAWFTRRRDAIVSEWRVTAWPAPDQPPFQGYVMHRRTSAVTATMLLAGALLTAGATAAQASPQSGTPSLRGPFTSQSVCDVQRTKLLAKMDGAATDCAY